MVNQGKVSKLYDELKEIDPGYAARVHPNNEKSDTGN